MAGKTKPGSALKGINIKLKMINDLMDVTGSAKDSWNPAEISDDMKAIAYIHRLADTWNPAQLNEALKYLGFATIDSWNPAIIEETKNKLVKYFLPTEATGNPITLNTYGNLPYEVSKAEVTFLPKQDLHGYDSPWVGGAGKNLLYNSERTITTNGITYTVYADGSFKVQGTSTGNAILSISNVVLTANIPYRLTGCPSGGGAGKWAFYANGTSPQLFDSGSGSTQTQTENKTGQFNFIVYNGQTVDFIVYPMLRVKKDGDNDTFAPYENICPISGRNSVTLTVNGDDTEITFEQTVYAGTVNVIEGGTSSTYGYIASYDGEELPGAWISDRDVYAAGTTPTTGAEVVYILTTPTELTTPANEIALVNGENTLSTDGDTINITYKAILNS